MLQTAAAHKERSAGILACRIADFPVGGRSKAEHRIQRRRLESLRHTGKNACATKVQNRELSMDLPFIGILICTGALSWWMSGYDARLVGDNRSSDLKRRIIRCGITLLLVGVAVGASAGGANGGGFIYIGITVPLALVWVGCLSEFFARATHSLIDSEDPRPHDPAKLTRELDELARLVKEGRNSEAIRLCTQLLKTKESSALAIDAALVHVYDQMFSDELLKNLPIATEAEQLLRSGRAAPAESGLRRALRQDPQNLVAAFSLLRLYARDLRSATKAKALLEDFTVERHFPPGFQEYCRRRTDSWLNPRPRGTESTEGIESLLVSKQTESQPHHSAEAEHSPTSIPELLSAGHYGSAIEILEKELAERPRDFDLWLTLAEAYGFHCRNLDRAARIISKMEANPGFTPDQIRIARSKLELWRNEVRK